LNINIRKNIVSVALSVIITIIISFLLLLILKKDPVQIYSLMLKDIFASGYGIGQTLFKTTPLILLGCGLALCFHASIFNIGAEGQLNAGSFVIGIVLYYLSPLPAFFAVPVSIIAGMLVSSLFGIIPALIKIKKGVSEVITTIMLNFVVLGLINYFLLRFFAVKATMHSEKINDSFMFPKLSVYSDIFQGSTVNISIILALITAVCCYIVIYKTKYGYKLRAIGFNPTASKYIGVDVSKIIFSSFTIGAALTAFAGVNFILGYKGYYEFGFSNNIGFTAIAVTLLAKNNPIGIIFSAFLFGILDYGGLVVNEIVPKEIMLVVQGVIILAIFSVDKIVKNYYLKKG
jgi:simple sugar transport system permease protein